MASGSLNWKISASEGSRAALSATLSHGSRVWSCRLELERCTNSRVLWPLLRCSASSLMELRITQRSIFSARPASLAASRKSAGGTSSPWGLSRRSSTS
ncbi:hypothetical protein D3C80_1655670 [compost metagenome]